MTYPGVMCVTASVPVEHDSGTDVSDSKIDETKLQFRNIVIEYLKKKLILSILELKIKVRANNSAD